MSYQYPDVGAFYDGVNATTFVVWAPHRQHVDVLIDRVPYAMEMDERGYWKTTVRGVGPGARYLFTIDRQQSLPDPASLSQPEGVHGPSAVATRDYEWSDDLWKGLAPANMIIYELHVGTFTHEGDFDGVISRLPHLKELGVNTIELMPVAQFPGDRNWGYDGVFPFAVQHSYGGAAGLKKLVDRAHREGVAVVLDVVYNHQGPEGNYLAAYGPYFTDKYKTAWGTAINFDDAGCDGVRHFYWQNAIMWLDNFHVDGLRLDAAHAILDLSAVHFLGGLRTVTDELQRRSGMTKVLIAECDLNDPRYINPPSRGGYGMDGQWVDEFHHALHALLTGEKNGYYEDFGDAEHLRKSLKSSYVYTGEYSKHRKRHFGASSDLNPYSQFVAFVQNHDQVGNRMLGDRLASQVSFEALKLAAGAYLLSPHIPMLFMGEEYGEKTPFQYFVSHTDAALVEAVREGRRKEFSYFGWEGEIPDPQSEDTFRKCVLSWEHESDADAAVLLGCYRWLIRFRKSREAMRGVDRTSLALYPPNNNVICFERKFEDDRVLVTLNFSKGREVFSSPSHPRLKKIFDSSSRHWNGPGEESMEVGTSVGLNPESAVIFEL